MEYVIRAEHKKHAGVFTHLRVSPTSSKQIWRYGIGIHDTKGETTGMIPLAEATRFSLSVAVDLYTGIMRNHKPDNSWLKEISIVAVPEVAGE